MVNIRYPLMHALMCTQYIRRHSHDTHIARGGEKKRATCDVSYKHIYMHTSCMCTHVLCLYTHIHCVCVCACMCV